MLATFSKGLIKAFLQWHLLLIYFFCLILSQPPVTNDDLPERILQGALQVKPNVREFRGSTVVFDDEAVEDGIDAVVFCTGYRASFPFLLSSENNNPVGEVSLYRRVFPLYIERPTLAFLGLLTSFGPLMPIMEMQARWATRVFAGITERGDSEPKTADKILTESTEMNADAS